MSFTTKQWKDRISEYPTRRTLTDTTSSAVSTVTVAREEGTISQQGDAFSAANMNDLENRVGIEFSTINSNLGGTTFSVTADGAYVHYTPTGGADPVVKKLGSQDFNFKLYVSGMTNGQDPSIIKAAAITLDVTDYKTVKADYAFTVDDISHPANTNVDISNLTGNHSIGFSYISATPYNKTVSFLLYI